MAAVGRKFQTITDLHRSFHVLRRTCLTHSRIGRTPGTLGSCCQPADRADRIRCSPPSGRALRQWRRGAARDRLATCRPLRRGTGHRAHDRSGRGTARRTAERGGDACRAPVAGAAPEPRDRPPKSERVGRSPGGAAFGGAVASPPSGQAGGAQGASARARTRGRGRLGRTQTGGRRLETPPARNVVRNAVPYFRDFSSSAAAS